MNLTRKFFSGDARRSKQYIVNQSKQNTIASSRPTTVRQTTSSSTTTTTLRPTYEQTTTRIVPSTYRPTQQPRNQFNDNNVVSTYRPAHNFNNQRNGKLLIFSGILVVFKYFLSTDDEILKQSQSSHFFNSKNSGKDDFDDDVIKSTKAPIKPKVRGRHRGRSKFRNQNEVTSSPSRNSVTIVSTQKTFTEQQARQTSFTNTPIVVQPLANNRFDYDNFRSNNNSIAPQSSTNYRASTQTSTLPPPTNSYRDETFFDVPKINQQITKLKSSPAQNFDFKSHSTTQAPHNPVDSFQQQFGAIPQRVIIPSKLSKEERRALQASNANNFQSTAASTPTPTTANPQFVPQFNRVNASPSPNQLRSNSEQKFQQKDFNSLPQKFNFKTQKYESVEPQNPTTQFYNPKYETKGTDPSFNLEPTRSGLTKQTNKTFATRQLSTLSQEENRPTTFNPQQYYQAEQSQNQNLSPRGFSLAAQQQQEPKKTTQPEPRPQITSRSESRNHKKFSTLVPKDQYNPTTFKPTNNFSKKPVDSIASQKLEKIQNPNKYYAQFTSTPTQVTSSLNTTPQPQYNNFNSQSTTQQQFNNFNSQTTPQTFNNFDLQTNQQPIFNNFQTQTTAQPQFNNYNSQFENNHQQQTTRISNFFSSTPSVRPLEEGEEDDGQYRPELYEKDFFRNKVKTTKITTQPARNNFNNNNNNNFFQTSTTFRPQNQNVNSGEDEFLKTAHSQNIFASGNQLRAEKERERSVAKFNDFSTAITEKSSPRPFSKPTAVPSTTSVKPKKKGKEEKDVSYDYQYYDTNADQHDYSELEAIEDFGKTAKKSSSN